MGWNRDWDQSWGESRSLSKSLKILKSSSSWWLVGFGRNLRGNQTNPMPLGWYQTLRIPEKAHLKNLFPKDY
jgi:hypothetical protein